MSWSVNAKKEEKFQTIQARQKRAKCSDWLKIKRQILSDKEKE